MKALRIKAFQETVCYKKPFANKVTETYPLPPYSTVKGMIHAVLEAEQLIPFSLSIQGDYETMLVDYRKTYFVKRHALAMPIILDGLATEQPIYSNKVMTSMPLYTHMLFNVKLVFHIKADNEILENIYDAFSNINHFISLGRHEDLLRIDEVDLVALEETDNCDTPHAIYIPKTHFDEEGLGIPYLLNWTYKIKKGIREWEKIPSIYIPQGRNINIYQLNQPILIDDKRYPVFWNN